MDVGLAAYAALGGKVNLAVSAEAGTRPLRRASRIEKSPRIVEMQHET